MDHLDTEVPPVSFAVIGAGVFGKNHMRVYRDLAAAGVARLCAIVDVPGNEAARFLAKQQGARYFESIDALVDEVTSGKLSVEAASVCAPTVHHFEIAKVLLGHKMHVLIEKPITTTLEQADCLLRMAEQNKVVLRVGHLERFNPAVTAVLPHISQPMFFECHRLSVFTPRSLDVDVVLDLMIHDLDIILYMARSRVREIRAVGLPVLSDHYDIANVRLEFESGCVANLTASRVSTERVRKLRLFQPHEYISLDYARQEALRIEVSPHRTDKSNLPVNLEGLKFSKYPVQSGEPLQIEIEDFLQAIQRQDVSITPATQSRDALELALAVNKRIADHAFRRSSHADL